MKHINKNISIVEIFQRVRELEGTVDDKAKLLAVYDRKDVRWLVDFAYNGPVPLNIPEFKRSNRPYGIAYLTVLTGLPKLNSALQYVSNQAVFDRNLKLVLENVSPEEADLLVEIFSGKKFEGVSKAVLKRVYPTFFRPSDEEAV
ncbi:hypothetical protein D3C80_1462390 [compost metagenome]